METTEEKKVSVAETKKCACFCHKMPGVFVVLVGVAILLRALNVLGHTAFWVIASILIILAGMQTMGRSACKCCNAA